MREILPSKTSNTDEGLPPKREPTGLSPFARRKLEQASEMGLVAMWSRHYGYVSVHDPATGEWHDLSAEDAPGWSVREARRRKELRMEGDLKAYQLNSREAEKAWRDKQAPADIGIVEEFPVEEGEET